MKEIVIVITMFIGGFFAVYLGSAGVLWIMSDPLNIIDDIDFSSSILSKEERCRIDIRFMFMDIVDTWGVNTNNQDSISKTMLEMYDKCVKE